jgi:small acid-soluble spore protein D (minor alpha/beta-type SASP)
MADNNNSRPVVPGAAEALNQLKYEVAQEIGWNPASLSDLQQKIDRSKYEIAAEINVPLKQGYNGDLTSRQAGAVGGRLGGRLGGQMVKRMIALAEQTLSGQQQ